MQSGLLTVDKKCLSKNKALKFLVREVIVE